jgi:hypothetical protein
MYATYLNGNIVEILLLAFTVVPVDTTPKPEGSN